MLASGLGHVMVQRGCGGARGWLASFCPPRRMKARRPTTVSQLFAQLFMQAQAEAQAYRAGSRGQISARPAQPLAIPQSSHPHPAPASKNGKKEKRYINPRSPSLIQPVSPSPFILTLIDCAELINTAQYGGGVCIAHRGTPLHEWSFGAVPVGIFDTTFSSGNFLFTLCLACGLGHWEVIWCSVCGL